VILDFAKSGLFFKYNISLPFYLSVSTDISSFFSIILNRMQGDVE